MQAIRFLEKAQRMYPNEETEVKLKSFIDSAGNATSPPNPPQAPAAPTAESSDKSTNPKPAAAPVNATPSHLHGNIYIYIYKFSAPVSLL